MNNFYFPINPIGTNSRNESLDELEISVKYDKGGYNYFNGNIDRRGIYVYLKPVHRGEYSISSWITGNRKETGIKIFIKELGRLSNKQLAYYSSLVEPLGEKIASLYNDDDYQSIYCLVKSNLV